ncbi:MAG: hypothetical protein ACLRMZ_07200 [Blautia marasmi]
MRKIFCIYYGGSHLCSASEACGGQEQTRMVNGKAKTAPCRIQAAEVPHRMLQARMP